MCGVGAVLREVIIDCNDPRRVADFWAATLGWTVQQNDEVFWMSESGAPLPDLLLVFVPVPERKSVKAPRKAARAPQEPMA